MAWWPRAVELVIRLAETAIDTAPILAVFVVFQLLVLRRKLPNLGRIVVGFVCVLAGLTLFLVGLEEALFPIGETMALQLTAPAAGASAAEVRWDDYLLVYAFAAAIGFATTVAEPSLIAIALKAEEVSGGAVRAQGLRIAVAIGVAVGVSLGCFRIVTGTPLPWYIMAAYAVVIVQGELERETGLEPATPTLARLCSTTELFPLGTGILPDWRAEHKIRLRGTLSADPCGKPRIQAFRQPAPTRLAVRRRR